MWIITLQTRHFFRGEITLLAEFVHMKNKLTARDPLIYHAEVPDILINGIYKDKGGKRQRDFEEEKKTGHDSDGGGGSPNKKTKTEVHKNFSWTSIVGFGGTTPASQLQKCANSVTVA